MAYLRVERLAVGFEERVDLRDLRVDARRDPRQVPPHEQRPDVPPRHVRRPRPVERGHAPVLLPDLPAGLPLLEQPADEVDRVGAGRGPEQVACPPVERGELLDLALVDLLGEPRRVPAGRGVDGAGGQRGVVPREVLEDDEELGQDVRAEGAVAELQVEQARVREVLVVPDGRGGGGAAVRRPGRRGGGGLRGDGRALQRREDLPRALHEGVVPLERGLLAERPGGQDRRGRVGEDGLDAPEGLVELVPDAVRRLSASVAGGVLRGLPPPALELVPALDGGGVARAVEGPKDVHGRPLAEREDARGHPHEPPREAAVGAAARALPQELVGDPQQHELGLLPEDGRGAEAGPRAEEGRQAAGHSPRGLDRREGEAVDGVLQQQERQPLERRARRDQGPDARAAAARVVGVVGTAAAIASPARLLRGDQPDRLEDEAGHLAEVREEDALAPAAAVPVPVVENLPRDRQEAAPERHLEAVDPGRRLVLLGSRQSRLGRPERQLGVLPDGLGKRGGEGVDGRRRRRVVGRRLCVHRHGVL
ncbi:hypothetical protein THAOC_18846 [Thalassiosira oceanica]|uniref:Uncharacterized protein n=1 Tax=Thalassiosira oceanica TaxID=159749 RepID=K0S3X4_THAOC|nr:hypothetical protein THAOC_18846 [Thalassiosira oceanica]|eukprot:EJK60748.1 hypothetical protein THAOC_18846 [Thalassiosira oceanica]